MHRPPYNWTDVPQRVKNRIDKPRSEYTHTELRFWTKTTTPENASDELLDDLHAEPTSDCILWKAARNHDGYGQFGYENAIQLAHRVAWDLHVEPLDDVDDRGEELRHDCDVRCCVSPKCLRTGTRSDNMQDMARRGRANDPDPDVTRRYDAADIAEIRRLYVETNMDCYDIAKSPAAPAITTASSIHRILTGKSYGDIETKYDNDINISRAAVNDEKALEIRATYREEDVTYSDLEETFNEARGTLSRIINGNGAYKHLAALERERTDQQPNDTDTHYNQNLDALHRNADS